MNTRIVFLVLLLFLTVNIVSADTVVLRTNGAGTYTEMTPKSGNNYANVHVANTYTWVIPGASSTNDTYNYQNATLQTTQYINSVTFTYRNLNDPGYIAPLVYNGTVLDIGSYQYFAWNAAGTITYYTNPITSGVWTFEDIHNYEFGMSAYSSGTMMITEDSLLINYDNIVPTDLQNSIGNHWINYTWTPSAAGTNTDSYNVSFNGTWYNGTTNNFFNEPVGVRGWGNISVYGYNNTYGMSITNVTDSIQLPNNIPAVPSITTPINNSIIKSHGVFLNAPSTDADGDSITYYMYGDTTDGTTLINISTTGNYTWNIEDYDVYYWKVRAYDGYEYSANTSLQQFTLLAPPDLQTPTNASTHTYSFPPLLHDLTFAWQDIGAPAYKYQVATDDDFNLITEEDTITSNTTTLSLEADDYYWRVYAYETSTDTLSNASNVREFTINETNGNGAITAIDGVVYEITTGGSIEVDGALVNIWNSTWSDSMLVGQNGYYYFDGVKDGTYSVRATKTGYTDSSIELVTVLALNTTTRNILLQSTSGAGQQYVDHYVKFIVKSLIGTLYSDVEVNVYLGDAVIPQYTGTTGTDGSISFELNEYQEYRITFKKTSPSIDREITLYPKDDSYTVYVDIGTMIDDLLNPDDEEQAITAIDVSVTKTIINDNTANITVNYNDIMDETSGLTLTLSQSIAGNTTNKTVLSTVDLGTINNTAYNFTVTNYNGESYLIEIEATHTTHGAIYRMYGIQFENTDTLFGFTVEVVGWLAIIFITWFALTATSVTVPHTAIGVCALATAMMAFGWGSYISVPGLGLAWIMSLAANFAQAKEASA